MKYKPIHNYELVPISTESQELERNQQYDSITKSKADKLRELKSLLDDNIITQEEFEMEKRRFLKVTISKFNTRGLGGGIDSFIDKIA